MRTHTTIEKTEIRAVQETRDTLRKHGLEI